VDSIARERDPSTYSEGMNMIRAARLRQRRCQQVWLFPVSASRDMLLSVHMERPHQHTANRYRTARCCRDEKALRMCGMFRELSRVVLVRAVSLDGDMPCRGRWPTRVAPLLCRHGPWAWLVMDGR
jgi:hypothetical protein